MPRIIKAHCPDDNESAKAAALNLADFAEEARNVVLNARKEAARIASEARAQAQSLQREGREQAYAEGFARGQADGYAQGTMKGKQEVLEQYQHEYSALLERCGRIVSSLESARQDVTARASAQVVEMAVMLAERIVGSFSTRNPSAAIANLAKALELAQYGGEMTVAVNPVELKTLQRELPQLLEALSVDGSVELVADEAVSSGGVKLFSSHGHIDATIESQLANAARALLGHATRRGMKNVPETLPLGEYVKTSAGALKPKSYVQK